MKAIRLEGGVGAASALKMAFGGWNKIGTALTAQAYAIARAYGVEDALAAEGVDSARFVRAGRKAWRSAPEMDEVAATTERSGCRTVSHAARPSSSAAGKATETRKLRSMTCSTISALANDCPQARQDQSMEPRGIEPLTSAMPWRRSPS